MGKRGFVSVAEWPAVETGLVNREAEFAENFIVRVLDDVGRIVKVMKKEPKKLCLYVAQDWKWRAFLIAAEHSRAGPVDLGKLMREVEKRLGLRIQRAELARFLQQMVQEIRKLSEEELATVASTAVDELQILREASDFIGRELGLSEVFVFRADDQTRYDPQNRAVLSLPLRPAVYLE